MQEIYPHGLAPGVGLGVRDKGLEDPEPPSLRTNRLPNRGRLVAVSLEVAMLEIHTSRAALQCGERNLNLHDERRVVLPVCIELPAQDEPSWRIPHQDFPPLTLGPVGAALIPTAAWARFDDDVLHRLGAYRM